MENKEKELKEKELQDQVVENEDNVEEVDVLEPTGAEDGQTEVLEEETVEQGETVEEGDVWWYDDQDINAQVEEAAQQEQEQEDIDLNDVHLTSENVLGENTLPSDDEGYEDYEEESAEEAVLESEEQDNLDADLNLTEEEKQALYGGKDLLDYEKEAEEAENAENDDKPQEPKEEKKKNIGKVLKVGGFLLVAGAAFFLGKEGQEFIWDDHQPTIENLEDTNEANVEVFRIVVDELAKEGVTFQNLGALLKYSESEIPVIVFPKKSVQLTEEGDKATTVQDAAKFDVPIKSEYIEDENLKDIVEIAAEKGYIAKVNVSTKEIEDLKKQLEDLKEKSDKEIKDLKKQLEDNKKASDEKIAGLENVIKQLQEQVAEDEQDIADKDAIIDKLNDIINAEKEKNSDLEKQIEQLKGNSAKENEPVNADSTGSEQVVIVAEGGGTNSQNVRDSRGNLVNNPSELASARIANTQFNVVAPIGFLMEYDDVFDFQEVTLMSATSTTEKEEQQQEEIDDNYDNAIELE